MKRTYRIAQKNIEISSLHNDVHSLCRDYITDDAADFSVEINEQDIDFERKKSEDEDKREGIPTRQFSDGYLETLAVYRKIAEQMIEYDTFLFHGSAVAVDGEAYLFAAKSGTGKSTHTRLWREHFGERAVMVNDDKPLLMIKNDKVYVCGTPWNGKHMLGCNMIAPLKAICILNRDTVNHIEQVSPLKALPFLLRQTYKSSNKVNYAKTLSLLEKLTQKVKLYSLGCNMEPNAAVVSYSGMQD